MAEETTPVINSVSTSTKTVDDIFALLKDASSKQASDVHLNVGQKPIFRINGEITRQNYQVLDKEMVEQMIFATMTEEQKNQYISEQDIDYCIEIENVARFRTNAFYDSRGPAIEFRIIPNKVLTFDELGLPEVLKKITKFDKGLVLVTGPTGSGKSTTMAALIDLINKERKNKLITIEDPVEFIHQSKKCLVQHREVGMNTKSFASALRGALREDADIIMVGELRDRETIELALSVAETGALVFGTLHTSSAAKSVTRIIDVFPAREQAKVRAQLGEALKAVVAQVLLKKVGGGRCAAFEILFGTQGICNMIAANQISLIANSLETSRREGMNSMDQALVQLIQNNQITKDDALVHASSEEKILTA